MKNDTGYIVFIGGPCIDEYYVMDEWPAEGDKACGRFIGNIPGGMIANAACVSAALGVKTYCFDARGDNETTAFLLQDLRNSGVDPSQMVLLPDFKDSKCIIFQSGEERTIVVVMGDQHTLEPTDEQLAFLCGASYVYTSLQYQSLFTDFPGLCRKMKESGVKLVFDNETATYRDNWEEILQYSHTVFFNELSLDRFRGELAMEAFFDKLLRLGVENIVVTRGKEGCTVMTAGERFSVGVYGVDVVDTTGAGDTFNSAFTVELCRGWALRDAAVFATAAANRSVEILGPRSGAASEAAVRRFMAEREATLGEGTPLC